MGQPVVVVAKAAPRSGMLRFEANRTLTGMGHERYARTAPVIGERPPDELARRVFAHGGVDEIHIYGNVMTVTLARGHSGEGISEIVASLYTYYREGVTPAIP